MESTPATYADAFHRASDEAAALVAPLTPEAFNWKPSPEEWSVAECLAHLNKGNTPYLPALERALSDGGPRGEPPFHYGPLARWFIAGTGPQPKRKAKAIRAMRPAPRTDYESGRVLAEFRALNDGFLAVLSRAERERLDLGRIKMSSPFIKLIRLPAGAFLETLAGHEQRHLDQARRVTQRPGFPAASVRG